MECGGIPQTYVKMTAAPLPEVRKSLQKRKYVQDNDKETIPAEDGDVRDKIKTSIEIHQKPMIPRRHIRHTASSHHICRLPDQRHLVVYRRLVGRTHPISHRARQDRHPIPGPLGPRCRRCLVNEWLPEASRRLATAVGGGDGGGTIIPLLDADVAMSGPVIRGFELEFHPSRRDSATALDAAFEGEGEAGEGLVSGGYGDGFEGFVEVGAGGAVAVPVVVEKEVGVDVVRAVVEDDAGFFAVIRVAFCGVN